MSNYHEDQGKDKNQKQNQNLNQNSKNNQKDVQSTKKQSEHNEHGKDFDNNKLFGQNKG